MNKESGVFFKIFFGIPTIDYCLEPDCLVISFC